ncbi:DUF3429 domain-containing protein [Sphingomonas sp. KR1UV-12]|uniref:DUF3429 domain-containing protein n=1 Tax=Sphingomonas aurea TaxID=3063994 RepID=A0ABT9EJR6_9SPHN|nr:DUF3429 domain-containing protein [Sphingomonas sp. KR1UV-12]MDP1027210.1 DUF3429 domain-containing protein [Sphingomonas sp. KR1UV-12]
MARVGGVAKALGFAGLLPQIAAVLLMVLGSRSAGDMGGILALAGYWLAMIYGALILSFLGGIWWGFAMRRTEGQGRLVTVAVVPSLVAFAMLIAASWTLPHLPQAWPAMVLGSAILLTLVVDRHLVSTSEVPAGWMALRVPLSSGLGGLTIVAGILIRLNVSG